MIDLTHRGRPQPRVEEVLEAKLLRAYAAEPLIRRAIHFIAVISAGEPVPPRFLGEVLDQVFRAFLLDPAPHRKINGVPPGMPGGRRRLDAGLRCRGGTGGWLPAGAGISTPAGPVPTIHPVFLLAA